MIHLHQSDNSVDAHISHHDVHAPRAAQAHFAMRTAQLTMDLMIVLSSSGRTARTCKNFGRPLVRPKFHVQSCL